jgi:hypothetical protein
MAHWHQQFDQEMADMACISHNLHTWAVIQQVGLVVVEQVADTILGRHFQQNQAWAVVGGHKDM